MHGPWPQPETLSVEEPVALNEEAVAAEHDGASGRPTRSDLEIAGYKIEISGHEIEISGHEIKREIKRAARPGARSHPPAFVWDPRTSPPASASHAASSSRTRNLRGCAGRR